MSPRSRSLLVLSAFVVLLIFGGYFYVKKFQPQLFDREVVNDAELSTLKDATLETIAVVGDEWPQWLGPTRNGIAPPSNIRSDWAANPPKKLWETPCGGGHSSFALVDGKLFTMSYANGVEEVAWYDAKTGSRINGASWDTDYSGIDRNFANGPRATPTVVGGHVYCVGASGIAKMIRLADATTVWEAKYPIPQWGFARSPLIVGSNVLIQSGTKDAMLTCFDASTGATKWTAPGDADGYSSPTAGMLAGKMQIVAFGGSSLMGYDAETGKQLWAAPWQTQFQGNIATPLIVGDYVFISSAYAKGCALFRIAAKGDAYTAEQVYFRPGKVMQNHHSNCVHKDGMLYGYDGEDLRCVDLRKGKQVPDWEGRTDDNKPLGKGCVILAGDKLVILSHAGDLFLADADPVEFRLRGELRGVLNGPRAWSLPILVGGVLYLRDDSKIVAYDLR